MLEIKGNEEESNLLQVVINEIEEELNKLNAKYSLMNDQEIIEQLYNLCTKNNGDCSLILHFITAKKSSQRILIDKYSLDPNSDVLQKLRLIFGYQNVWIR